MKRILLIEDDKDLNKGLSYSLKTWGYEVKSLFDGKEALKILEQEDIDLLIVDVNLPDISGFDLCKKVRCSSSMPFIFLTACDLEESILNGFKLGADDYITKPFNIKIFKEKISAILRRYERNNPGDIYEDGILSVDFDRNDIIIDNGKMKLTPTELKLLYIFIKNKGIVLTRDILLQKLWDCDGNYVEEHTLTVNINRLRNKLDNPLHKYIKTVYGMGYIFE